MEITPQIEILEAKENEIKIEIKPLPKGLATTIGNSLRRTLISFVPGYAIYGVIINGVYHQFSTIKGVVQDLLDITQNLKKVRLRPVNSKISSNYHYTLSISNQSVFKAGDLATKITDFEIVNPDLIICEMDPSVTLKMELFIDSGKGFTLANENRNKSSAIGFIPIDSIYSPVLRANFRVEDISRTQFERNEKLILEVETDGTISPLGAIQYASKFLIKNFELISTFAHQNDNSLAPLSLDKEEKQIDTYTKSGTSSSQTEKTKKSILDRQVKYLGFSTRTLNRLEYLGIRTVGELIKKSEEELMEVRGIGKVVIQEIKDILAKYGLSLNNPQKPQE